MTMFYTVTYLTLSVPLTHGYVLDKRHPQARDAHVRFLLYHVVL